MAMAHSTRSPSANEKHSPGWETEPGKSAYIMSFRGILKAADVQQIIASWHTYVPEGTARIRFDAVSGPCDESPK